MEYNNELLQSLAYACVKITPYLNGGITRLCTDKRVDKDSMRLVIALAYA